MKTQRKSRTTNIVASRCNESFSRLNKKVKQNRKNIVGETWDLSDDRTYRTAGYFRDHHVIKFRFDFSERSEVSLVVKSHVCVRMEQEAWWLEQKNCFSWFKVKKLGMIILRF